jgi:hypothetical protein
MLEERCVARVGGGCAVKWQCSGGAPQRRHGHGGVPDDDGGFDSLAGDIVIVPRLECPSAVPISISISFILIAQLQQGTLLDFLLTLYTHTALYMHTALRRCPRPSSPPTPTYVRSARPLRATDTRCLPSCRPCAWLRRRTPPTAPLPRPP